MCLLLCTLCSRQQSILKDQPDPHLEVSQQQRAQVAPALPSSISKAGRLSVCFDYWSQPQPASSRQAGVQQPAGQGSSKSQTMLCQECMILQVGSKATACSVTCSIKRQRCQFAAVLLTPQEASIERL